jgi:hypothetical protein
MPQEKERICWGGGQWPVGTLNHGRMCNHVRLQARYIASETKGQKRKVFAILLQNHKEMGQDMGVT